MKHLLRWCVLGLVLGGALLPAPEAAAKTVTVHQRDQGQTVVLAVGDTLLIHVAEPDPHSRQSWRLENYDRSVLRSSGSEGRPVTERGRRERQFSFQAVGRGSSTISLALGRAGLFGRSAADHFRVTVRVGGDGGAQPAHVGRSVVITENEASSRVRVSRGDTLVVRLRPQGRPTHNWAPVQEGAGILRPVGKPRLVKTRGGTVAEFHYEVIGSGRASLAFAYQHSRFRGPDPFRRSFEVTVEAGRGGWGPRR